MSPVKALSILQSTFKPTPLIPIDDPWLKPYGVEVWLKRDDLIHPIISGNKWRKLKYPLLHACSKQATTLVSMGGAYSNHLHALAFTAQHLGLASKAFIRGEQPKILNPTLQDLLRWQMQLKFISRSEYRQLRAYKHEQVLPNLAPGEYWLPEGGNTALALQGVAELVAEIKQPTAVLCAPCGTGTTLAGIIAACSADNTVLGFAALKGAHFLATDIARLVPLHANKLNWTVQLAYHFGGFAKVTCELLSFIQRFERNNGVKLEPIYTGKMLFGIYDLIARGYFATGQRIVALHTGGLQGWR